MKILIILTIITFCNYAISGTETGNGGNIIVCNDLNSPHHLKVLDSYEAERNGFQPKWNNRGNWKDLVKMKLEDWQSVAKIRMQNYLHWLETFELETKFSDEIAISEILDQGAHVLPDGCELKQVAMQRRDDQILPGMSRYEINLKYWSQMRDSEKATLVLHEIVYREAIKSYHENSSLTRYFVGYLLGSLPDSLDYFRIVTRIHFSYAELFNSIVSLKLRSCNQGDCRFEKPLELNKYGWPIKAVTVKPIEGFIKLPHFVCQPIWYDDEERFIKIKFINDGFVVELGSKCVGESFRVDLKLSEKEYPWMIGSLNESKEVRFSLFGSMGELENIYFLAPNFRINFPNYLWYQMRYLENCGLIPIGDENGFMGVRYDQMGIGSSIKIDGTDFGRLSRIDYDHVEKYEYGAYYKVREFFSSGSFWRFSDTQQKWIKYIEE